MPTEKYVAPQWRYDYGEPKGKRMRLLSIDEVKLASKLLSKHIRFANGSIQPDRYKPNFRKHMEYADKIWLSASRAIRNITALPENDVHHHEMDALNQDLQLIFSDAGWRWIRKEISQLKKREKKYRFELSADLSDQIKAIMVREDLKKFDDVIDFLILYDKEEQLKLKQQQN
ncbi:hypothetical protein [Shewanella algicola]|uniref:hypothetical protein n=1 Tax=Shewanella algicola TaxID=640633 RepID=UPI00249531E2|nr:hypothetical protein [Shewanella algicola]